MSGPNIIELPFDIDLLLGKYDPQGRLTDYFELLMAENQKVNLVSRETTRDDLRRLAAESLIPLEVIATEIGKYLDIGSGGGFPSIPILLSRKVAGRATLVERTGKKASALERLLEQLGLQGAVLRQTFEEVRFDSRFDLVTLRYVKPSGVLMKNVAAHLETGGYLVHYSAPVAVPPDLVPVSYSFAVPETSVHKHFTVYTKQS